MKKPNITEGKWEVDETVFGSGSPIVKTKNGPIADIYGSTRFGNKPIVQTKSNAQAISAVPNLIKEGCKIVYAYENDMGVTDAEIESLKQALKKAGCKE